MCKTLTSLLAGATLLVVGMFSAVLAEDAVSFSRQAAFDEVLQDLEDAIVNRGFVIDYTAKIGDMLARTAADVGASKQIYLHATGMQFCSATYSRATMEADPANIVFCPYVIFAYELAGEPGIVHVAYRKPVSSGSDDSKVALGKVDALLEEIAREATQ